MRGVRQLTHSKRVPSPFVVMRCVYNGPIITDLLFLYSVVNGVKSLSLSGGREGFFLTLRRLMSYIYIYMEHPFLMFLDHTQRRSTVGRTPLDE